ncbi:ABC transporter ATP-binding protein [Entomobacter blattae]|uniref:Vitamin B12 import ATP-binding protein BtuD n=1 Tax=Entomobacter blattae TaxID=2762277 RepID=A0A7H1NQM7_9PROT|nr:ABC transporter ATP-binding protein [Entomobacter blattae]QNT78087.1 Vitamin B12 import ATP-binding protein BtuD [Entomobacter blattae]
MQSKPLPPPQASILVNALSLEFPIYHGEAKSLKKTLFQKAKNSLLSNAFSNRNRTGGQITVKTNGNTQYLTVQALKDLSFHIAPQERVGLVGHNGAGKSTLLKVLAGIYEGNPGAVAVEGKISALLDATAGMNMQLSGRENIHLWARQHKLIPAEEKQLEENVEQFADLGEFFDLPLRLYSSGMIMRVGFGLITASTPQILLMDEWFMAGDANFQEKARIRLENIVQSAEILVLTTHAISILYQWCTRIFWLEKGELRMDGDAPTVLAAYLESVGSSLEQELPWLRASQPSTANTEPTPEDLIPE